MDYHLTDNSDEVLNALQAQIGRALEAIGLQAEGDAKLKCPVDTGNLRGSITHTVRDKTAYIGTNVEYAKYVEYGTGIYVPGGRQDPWVYQDDEGKWHRTSGQPPAHFLQSIGNHLDEYKQIVRTYLQG